MGLNIQYVLTAEFHIDKGPSILNSYPTSIPGFEHGTLPFLPELMLPDQIHKREEDYTLFLLYRNISSGHYQYVHNRSTCEAEPYFLYTIVNNKNDNSVRRGAVIKSLSIITRLKYFPSFKPLLLIALDSYFDTNNTSILRQLYDSVNVKNLSITNGSKDISLIKKFLITSILDLPINDTIYHDEYFRNKLLGFNTDSNNSNTTNTYNTNNGNSSSGQSESNSSSSNKNKDLFIRKDLSFNSIVNFLNFNIPIKIPLIDLPDTIGDYLNPTDINFKPNLMNLLNASLATEVKNNDLTIYGLQTPPIIILINALLTGKKILFLGYEKSSSYIIDYVLLTLKIISGGGILSGFLTNFNVFPMIDVSKIDILESCDSYLAGTINPFFKNNDKWWDLLYDLDTNEFHISSSRSESGNENSTNFVNNFKVPIISEDAKFLSNLQLSIYNYHDDLTTIQLIFRRHINEIIRILISSKNFNSANFLPISSNNGSSLEENISKSTLLLDGIGYYWTSDTTKLLEMSCYQSISKKFQDLLYSGKLIYNLSLPNLSNELNLMIDLQYHLQSLISSNSKLNEREVWFNILKYLISGQSLETFLLITYLIPPLSSSSSSSSNTGNMTTFDKNKGFELLLINLFNKDDRVKSNIVMILQELQDNFLCGWCLGNFIKSNLIYEIAFNELVNDV
ncbi:hypothetical protein CAAN1_12S03136 [[Candida] anglica]|uniref:UDENN domain-containing protein n=1 Tax=[Candida] anglica TaxID=148631 RepID=A0ABP0E6W4_9ASCO